MELELGVCEAPGPAHHQNKQINPSNPVNVKSHQTLTLLCRVLQEPLKQRKACILTLRGSSTQCVDVVKKHGSVAASYPRAIVSCRRMERRLGGAAWVSGRGCPQRCSLTRKRVPGCPRSISHSPQQLPKSELGRTHV